MATVMVSRVYFDRLQCPPSASLPDVKAAYHRAAKSNHPDLFPEAERERREMVMMQINEAYMAIVCDRAGDHRGGATAVRAARPAVRRPTPSPESREIGPLRDPAYTYYKLGFRYFSEGRRTLSRHYLSGALRIDFSTENIDVLRHAVAALHYFHKAYSCFDRVSSEYPSSVWARDSGVKIYYLNRFNAIYQRICENLSTQISKLKGPVTQNPA